MRGEKPGGKSNQGWKKTIERFPIKKIFRQEKNWENYRFLLPFNRAGEKAQWRKIDQIQNFGGTS